MNKTRLQHTNSTCEHILQCPSSFSFCVLIWCPRCLETALCKEVASAAAAFEMRGSGWNRGVGSGRAVFEVCNGVGGSTALSRRGLCCSNTVKLRLDLAVVPELYAVYCWCVRAAVLTSAKKQINMP